MGDNTAARKQLQLHHNPVIDVSLNVQGGSNYIDDDGLPKQTGTIWTACSHIITAVVGSWAMAQLGWIAGPVVMVMLSVITSHFLLSGSRHWEENCTYSDAVRSHLVMSFTYSGIGLAPGVAKVAGTHSFLYYCYVEWRNVLAVTR
ncbi:amino acid permease 3-like [Pyrus x bretschneideri]|uniref:amino acid permease 3-like n=1 Tax=Pyrus x bretschneideri TaxID=225117 RepID=UPI00202DDC06|nr:amino acid permease 3-like [Pyrus x bretschneideri]